MTVVKRLNTAYTNFCIELKKYHHQNNDGKDNNVKKDPSTGIKSLSNSAIQDNIRGDLESLQFTLDPIPISLGNNAMQYW